MSSIGDFVKGVVGDVLQDLLRKADASKRARRRRRTSRPSAAERLRRRERRAKPARRQTSRRRTARSRSKAKRRS